MIRLKILSLILLFLGATNLLKANDDLVFNLSIQSSETSKTLYSNSNLQINFSSPQEHLINKVEINNLEVSNLSYTCTESVCNYVLNTNLNASVTEGPVTLSFINSNNPDFAKYHLEIETDYSFSTSTSSEPPAENPNNNEQENNQNDNSSGNNSNNGSDNNDSGSNTEDDQTDTTNIKSPANASASDLASITRFSSNTINPGIAYSGETLILSLVLKNKNDKLNFIQIAGTPAIPGPKTDIGSTSAYEVKFPLASLSSEAIRKVNSQLGFIVSINDKRFTNKDFGINEVKYLSLDADKVFLNRDIKIVKSTQAKTYDISFEIDRENSENMVVKAIVVNNDKAHLVNKNQTGTKFTYTSSDVEITNYENEIKISYDYFGDSYEFTYKFKLDENLGESDLSKLLEIASIESAFTSSFTRIGSTVVLVKLNDSSEEMIASKSIVPTTNYQIIKIDEINKQLLIAYELKFGEETDNLALLTNKNQTVNINNFNSSLSSSMPSSRLLRGPSTLTKKEISRIRKVKLDKKLRLVVRGRNLKKAGRLYMLDTSGNFTEILLGKTNKKFRKQFITSVTEIPNSAAYLIYFTSESGISFIEI
ncbi:MAG: hypothetical protein HRT47_02380 [Candidatus Caenarcaniphilales bacterium]|nr:hypothetical protein [Candidatus Caenarcaniphilales bacterium]